VAAAGRARERSLRQQAGAAATLVGILVDLAEQSMPVVIHAAGVRRTGRIVATSDDFCVLDPAGGASSSLMVRPSLVVTSAIAAIWPAGGAATPAGGRSAAVALSLEAALSLLAEERAPVRIVLVGDHEVAGDLLTVGDDVMTLAATGPSPRLVHVPVSALAVCDLI
jgi:hypothetical protein